MQIYGPSAIVNGPGDITAELNATSPEHPFVTVGFPGGVHFYLDAGDADVLIKVFCQAKEMLAAHRNAVACHAGIGEYVAEPAHVAEGAAPGRVKLCRCDRDPFPHTPWPGCPEWKDAQGLPVAEDDGGDGDDNREPYCVKCGIDLTAAGEHIYEDAAEPEHETETGWRQPVGREIHGVQAYVDLQADSLGAGWKPGQDMENAQSAEVRRIGKLHTDGHITDAECAQMVDKVLGEHA